MLDIVRRYSEERYYRKQDFMKEFDATTAHVLWDETQNYRHLFRYDIPFTNPSCYVVLCRQVTFALLRCERKMQHFCEQKEHRNYKMQKDIWEKIVFDFSSRKKKEITQWICKACEMLRIRQVNICEELLTSEEPILLRLFMCYQQMSEHALDVAFLLLLKENRVAMMCILDTYVPIHMHDHAYENDKTYEFLKFIEQIELKIIQGMVLLERTCDSTHVDLDVHELSQRYPQLSMTQITFYKRHNSAEHYYTISHFMEFTGVCYETARSAMDMLVELHWYQKRKLGKKFVYYI